MARIATKWPRLLIEGQSVSPEQAEEIILRTTTSFFTNDREWLRLVGRVLEIESEKEWGDFDWKSLELWQKRMHVLPLSYLDNDMIMSTWIGGPRGWVNWNGAVSATTWNIGKWPSVEEIEEDLELIATAFPFLNFRMQLLEDEGEGELCGEWWIADGRWQEVPLGERINPVELDEQVLIDRVLGQYRERGVSLERLQSAYSRLKENSGEKMARIVRKFSDDTPDQPVMENVSIADAKAHCSRSDTSGEGWFDVWYRDAGDDE